MSGVLDQLTEQKEIKEEWVKRLRSRDYMQGKNFLRCGEKFCCLGVLCEIAVEKGILVRKPSSIDADAYVTGNNLTVMKRMIVSDIAEWAGISMEQAETLASKNDKGFTFDSIATDIEQEMI